MGRAAPPQRPGTTTRTAPTGSTFSGQPKKPAPKKKPAWYEDPFGAVSDWIAGDTDDTQMDALDDAAAGGRMIGDTASDKVLEGQASALKGFAPAKSTLETMQTELGGPGSAEQFYQDMQKGSSEYFNRARDKDVARLNQQAIAKGNFGGGGHEAGVGNYLAESRGKEEMWMGNLAAQAQAAKEGRYHGLFGAGLNLGQAEAGVYGMFTPKAADMWSEGQYYALDAELQKAGIPAAMRQQVINVIMGALKVGGTVAGAKAGG